VVGSELCELVRQSQAFDITTKLNKREEFASKSLRIYITSCLEATDGFKMTNF
jgi:hypothetical protein